MTTSGFFILLISAMSCCAAPNLENDHCQKPEQIKGAQLQGEWHDETYPPGKVANFACLPEYTQEGSIKMACIEGTWWDIAKGQCKESGKQCGPPPTVQFADTVEIRKTNYNSGESVKYRCPTYYTLEGNMVVRCLNGVWDEAPVCQENNCRAPVLDNGRVLNSNKNVYKNDEVMQYTCSEGFHATRNGESTCTKDEWIPKPYCEEIMCNPFEPVEKGKLLALATKTQYKYGDEIDVQCEEGYALQTEPYKRRECTANGWFPSARCVSNRCDRPEILQGVIDSDYYYPKELGRYLYYQCKENYQPSKWTIIYCTNVGWQPEPKCSRQCLSRDAYFENAQLTDLKSVYVEGEKVWFNCDGYYRTPDGKSSGERTCLPNGKFTPAKCSVTCKAPQLQNGKFNRVNSEYEAGEFLQYECNKGYMTESRHLSGKAQCRDGRWHEDPHCIPITCEHNGHLYYDGAVIKYKCPRGQRPRSDIGQCYYYGWGPPLSCQDVECTIPRSLNLVRSPSMSIYKFNNKVRFSCGEGFVRFGPFESICTEGGWNPPLPTCQEEKMVQPQPTDQPSDGNKEQEKRQKCPIAYSPQNAEIVEPKEEYYSHDTVTMKCNRKYKMYGSPTVRCVEGKWEQPPECIRVTLCMDPPGIENGIIESSKQEIYVTDDVVKYSCKFGFHISGSDQSTCVNEQWSTLPTCTEDACAEAPKILHGTAVVNKKIFNHGERAKYKCENGFRLKEEDSASCIEGRWMNTPVCIETSCKPPPNVPNSKISGVKPSYASGEKVTYVCNPGFSLERSGEAQCEDTNWINLPACRRTGEQCGLPPTVQYGETVEIRKVNYKTGDKVEFRCPEYYILEGNSFVTCWNGVWNEAPLCIEPCTAKENDMEKNNIQLKWRRDRKLYSRHGDTMDFDCKSGFEALPDTQMRTTCEKGKLQYPKCYKRGFCTLQQSTMITNNIYYNISTIVDHGQTILFQCNEGMISENKLEAKCEWKNINYPKCTTAKDSSV